MGIQLLNLADISWGMRDEPLRTSLWDSKSKVVLSRAVSGL